MQLRITEPNSKLLYISDLVERLEAAVREHGDLPCYLYSTDTRADAPMLAECLIFSPRKLTFSAITGTVRDEILEDMIEENRRLRAEAGVVGG